MTVAEAGHRPIAITPKTQGLATRAAKPETLDGCIAEFSTARKILRSGDVVQAGAGAAGMDWTRPEDVSLFYLDGPPHRRRRAAIAPYFALKAIDSRYRPVMEATARTLVAQIAQAGAARLDTLAFQFAVAVAAEILGLDHSDLPGLTARIDATINTDESAARPIRESDDATLLAFYDIDVLPAIAARRAERRDDVISRLIDEGCSDAFITTDVRGYAFAGMVTTRELIVICAWHMLEQPALADRFRAADEREQLFIVEEILRLEPIVGYLRRRAAADLPLPDDATIPAGASIMIDVRRANTDERATGPCPHSVDPARMVSGAPGTGYMSFGDGPHRCPGAQLSLYEARTFLDALMRLPGLRLVGAPELVWFRPIASYGFKHAAIACDPPLER